MGRREKKARVARTKPGGAPRHAAARSLSLTIRCRGASVSSYARLAAAGSQFTCFTGTKVQALTLVSPAMLAWLRRQLPALVGHSADYSTSGLSDSDSPSNHSPSRCCQFAGYTSTKSTILTSKALKREQVLYSVYLLCWYKRANTDAAPATTATCRPPCPPTATAPSRRVTLWGGGRVGGGRGPRRRSQALQASRYCSRLRRRCTNGPPVSNRRARLRLATACRRCRVCRG